MLEHVKCENGRNVFIGIKHDCESMNNIISTDKPLQHERRRRECCKGFSVLIILFIDEQECFIAIITHTYVTKMLFLQSYTSFNEKKNNFV